MEELERKKANDKTREYLERINLASLEASLERAHGEWAKAERKSEMAKDAIELLGKTRD